MPYFLQNASFLPTFLRRVPKGFFSTTSSLEESSLDDDEDDDALAAVDAGALAAAQLYREEGGDRALAEAVRCRRPCCVVIDHPRRAQKAAPLTGAVLVRRSATPSMRWRRTW